MKASFEKTKTISFEPIVITLNIESLDELQQVVALFGHQRYGGPTQDTYNKLTEIVKNYKADVYRYELIEN